MIYMMVIITHFGKIFINISFTLIHMVIAPGALQYPACDVQEELVQDVPGVPKALPLGQLPTATDAIHLYTINPEKQREE